MATTLTTDVQASGDTLLTDDAVDFFIRATVEEHGSNRYRFRAIYRKDAIPAGNGKSIKFVRVPRIVLAGTLTEGGPAPTATVLKTEVVTATAIQYGQVLELSDVADLVLKHPLAKRGMRELGEAAARKDDQILQNTALGASNVIYGDGSVSSRGALTTTSYLTTESMRIGLMGLEVNGDGVDGEAPRFGNGMYLFVGYTKHIQDLLSDADFKSQAIRTEPEALRRGIVRQWSDFDVMKNTFGPHFTNLGATEGAVGVTITAIDSPAGGGLNSSDEHYFIFTKTHKKRGFEEGISAEVAKTTSATGNDEAFDVLVGAVDDGYTWNIYFSDDTGTTKLVFSNLEGGTTQRVNDLPTVAQTTNPPASPAAGVTVYTSYGLSPESMSVTDLKGLQTFLHTKGDKSDPLNQKIVMGTKWFEAAAIVNDAWIRRFEAASRY